MPTVLGLVVGLALAWLLELRDTKIRSEGHLRELNAGPVLGLIPVDRRLREPLVRHKSVSTAGTESFRQLRTNLEFIDVNSPIQVLVVTSSIAQEGKTTTCVNLALTMVAAGKSVLVIQGDLRRPSLDDPLAMGLSAGLTDVIIGRADLATALQPSGVRGLMIMPSGPLPPNPSELLGSDAMVRLLESLRHRFDAIIINTPPLLPVTDAAVLAAHADGVLVVVRAGKTTREQLSQAMRSLATVGARVIGTVLNGTSVQRGPEYAAYWDTGAASPGTPAPGIPGADTSDAFRSEVATGRSHRALLRVPPESVEGSGNGRDASHHGSRTAPGRDEPRA
jgi:receptor protein-tyrosine kinase